MKFKGYMGRVDYDSSSKVFHGEVLGLKDVITFQGRNVDELEKAFKDSVNDYLDWCKERGEKPEKPYSGELRLRMPQELHAKLATAAQLKGQSLNTFIVDKLSK